MSVSIYWTFKSFITAIKISKSNFHEKIKLKYFKYSQKNLLKSLMMSIRFTVRFVSNLKFWMKHGRTELWCLTAPGSSGILLTMKWGQKTLHNILLSGIIFSVFHKWLSMYVSLNFLYQILFFFGQIYYLWKWLQFL